MCWDGEPMRKRRSRWSVFVCDSCLPLVQWGSLGLTYVLLFMGLSFVQISTMEMDALVGPRAEHGPIVRCLP